MNTPMLQCRACREEKPATPAHFVRRKGKLENVCKVCNVTRSYRSYRKGKEQQEPKKSPGPGRPPKFEKLPETELGKAIEAFLEAHKNRAYETLKGYRNTLGKYAQVFPDSFNAQTVTDWINREGISETSKMTTYGHIRAFAHWLHRTERVSTDPLKGIVRPRKVEILPRGPKEADIKGLIAFLENKVECALQKDPTFTAKGDTYRDVRDLAIFSLMLDTGLRVGEVCNLDVLDVDFDEMSAFVRRAKNRKQRYVMFGKLVKANLKLWLTVRKALDLDQKQQSLFASEYGCWGRVTRNGIEEALAARCKAAGVRKFTPHQLRHAHAGQAIKNGQNIEELRQQMGHSNIVMTARYFMLPSEGRLKGHLKTSPLDHLGGAV